MPDAAEMPRYRSHKTVHALEISSIVVSPHGLMLSFSEDFLPIEIRPSMFARYVPVPGDFFVVYDDGYKAISPRKAFLEGYDKI